MAFVRRGGGRGGGLREREICGWYNVRVAKDGCPCTCFDRKSGVCHPPSLCFLDLCAAFVLFSHSLHHSRAVSSLLNCWYLYRFALFVTRACATGYNNQCGPHVQLNKLKLRKMLWVNCRGLPLGWRGSHYLHADRSALSLATCRTERENVTQVKRAFSIESPSHRIGKHVFYWVEECPYRHANVARHLHPSPLTLNTRRGRITLTILTYFWQYSPPGFLSPPTPPPPPPLLPFPHLVVYASPCPFAFAPSCESLGGERFYTRLCGARRYRAFVITCVH